MTAEEDTPPPPPRRAKATLLALVMVLGAALVALAASGTADRIGRDAVHAGFQRALVAFGLARALNGVISVVQGTQIAIEPAGVGVNLAPGQILDPVNDLVERFSWVMLASTTSFGIQSLLLDILAWPGISAALALFVTLLALALWRRDGWLARRRIWLLRLALFLAMLRFLVPLLAVVGEGIHHAFIEPRYAQAVAGLELANAELGELARQGSTGGADESVWERLKRTLDVSQWLEQIKALAARTTEQTIELISIFTFQTILLPLAFLWFLRATYRMLLRAWRTAPARD